MLIRLYDYYKNRIMPRHKVAILNLSTSKVKQFYIKNIRAISQSSVILDLVNNTEKTMVFVDIPKQKKHTNHIYHRVDNMVAIDYHIEKQQPAIETKLDKEALNSVREIDPSIKKHTPWPAQDGYVSYSQRLSHNSQIIESNRLRSNVSNEDLNIVIAEIFANRKREHKSD